LGGGSTVRKLVIAAAVAQCLPILACQSGQGTKIDEPPSADRLEFVSQFKKIDAAGKGLITMEQAAAHYNIVFTGLDKNGDGFLDAAELQPLLPIMGAKTAAESSRARNFSSSPAGYFSWPVAGLK